MSKRTNQEKDSSGSLQILRKTGLVSTLWRGPAFQIKETCLNLFYAPASGYNFLMIGNGKYRNSKKGMVVEVIGMARHSETLEDMVVYTHEGEMWVRPAAMWFEEVEVNGEKVSRFVKIDN